MSSHTSKPLSCQRKLASSKICSKIFILLLTLFCCQIYADELIIEPDMGRAPILEFINQTQNNLQLVMYGFTDQTLLNAIIQKKLAGKTVKILLEPQPFKAENENNFTIKKLNFYQIPLQNSPKNIAFLHQKTLISDDKKALIMTFNFTKSTFKNDRNFALLIENPAEIRAINEIFLADWQHKISVNHHENLIFSPENSRKIFLNLIKNTRENINIYAQNISDYQVIGALANAAKRGVNIKILTATNLKNKQIKYLTRAGVQVKNSEKYYIHAKVMVIDHKKAVIGSTNLTRASLDNNRELSVISQDARVIQRLEKTFNEDWS